jgi:hypothetical protein
MAVSNRAHSLVRQFRERDSAARRLRMQFPSSVADKQQIRNWQGRSASLSKWGVRAWQFLLICPLIVAIRCGLHNLGDDRGNLLLGLGVALLTVYLHSWVEWSLATFSAEYLLAIAIGMVAGNARALGYWGAAQRLAIRQNHSRAVQAVPSSYLSPNPTKKGLI